MKAIKLTSTRKRAQIEERKGGGRRDKREETGDTGETGKAGETGVTTQKNRVRSKQASQTSLRSNASKHKEVINKTNGTPSSLARSSSSPCRGRCQNADQESHV